MNPLRLLPALLLGLVGCSADASLSEKDDGAGFGDPDEFQEGTLRLDITPPSGLASPDLRPQTLLAMPPVYTDLQVDLRPTITVSGTLLAEVAHPWTAAAGAPTEVLPYQGVVAAAVENSVEDGKAGADEDGAFVLPLVADTFYEMTLVPDDASASPLVVFQGLDLATDQDLSQTLPLGIPVYGRVTNGDGTALPLVPVRIHRADGTNRTPSSVVYTDQTGWYSLRVASAGEYAVEILGGETDAGDIVPALTLPVSVPDQEGASLYVDVGVLSLASIKGTLLDAAGDRLADARVRAVSTRLDASGGTLEIETDTDDEGKFTAYLLPGSYTVSYIPEYTPIPGASPTSVLVEVDAGDVADLGVVELQGTGRLAGTVTDADGDPVPGASIVATQTGYGRHTYNTVTDDDGSYRLDIPVTPYEVSVTPVGTGGAVTRRSLTPGQGGDIRLDVGQPITGTLTWEGEVVPFALVEVRDLRSGALLGAGSTDVQGRFALEVVIPVVDDEATDTGGTDTGGTDTGGTDTGGSDTGGSDTGGSDTGGSDTGGSDSGGSDTGGTGGTGTDSGA